MAQQRDNFKAGLFVLSGVILALVVILGLTDISRFFEKTQTVKVSYRIGEGLQGLKVGAVVTLADHNIGSITAIDDLFEDHKEPDRITGKLLTIAMPARIKLHRDAVFEIKAPLIGTGSRLNIREVGSGPPYKTGEVLAGQPALSDTIRQLGLNQDDVHRVQKVIADLERLTNAISSSTAPAGEANIEKIVADIRTLSAALARDIPESTSKLRKAVDEAEQVIAGIRDKSGDWLGRLDSVTKDLRDAVADARKLIQDKDPAIRQTVDNIRDITQTVRDKTLQQVATALDHANQALPKFTDILDHVKGILITQRPTIERALANAQVATEQLKLATIEVRRSPWRLLYKPSEKELETDNLYDSARSFAEAASVLESTTRGLKELTEQQPNDKEQIQKMLDHLLATYARYQQAENAFWDALGGKKLTPLPPLPDTQPVNSPR